MQISATLSDTLKFFFPSSWIKFFFESLESMSFSRIPWIVHPLIFQQQPPQKITAKSYNHQPYNYEHTHKVSGCCRYEVPVVCECEFLQGWLVCWLVGWLFSFHFSWCQFFTTSRCTLSIEQRQYTCHKIVLRRQYYVHQVSLFLWIVVSSACIYCFKAVYLIIIFLLKLPWSCGGWKSWLSLSFFLPFSSGTKRSNENNIRQDFYTTALLLFHIPFNMILGKLIFIAHWD